MEITGRFVATYTMPVLSSSIDSILGFIGLAVMFMVVMIAVTWTIFGLISQLSSQVFAWVGQAHHDLGENKGESAFMGAMASSKMATQSVTGGMIQDGTPDPKNNDEQNITNAMKNGEGGAPAASDAVANRG